MRKLKCIVVDDEPLAQDVIKRYCEKDDRLNLVMMCTTASAALAELQKNRDIDVIFLDINMPKISGLELLRSLKNPPNVIFTTAYREYAIEAFDLNAIDYLVKPITFERFLQAVNKVFALAEFSNQETSIQEEKSQEYFLVKADGKLIKIDYSDLQVVEAFGEYVKLHTRNGTILTHIPLNQVEEKLPNQAFCRIHRSYIVSLSYVSNVEGNMVAIGKSSFPISRSFKDAFLERLGTGF